MNRISPQVPTPDAVTAGPIAAAEPLFDAALLRRGLARTMVLRTFPIIAAIVLATQLAIGLTNYRGQLAALQARADLIAQLTAEAIARPLWNLDRPVYESQLQAVTRDPAFVALRLTDPAGATLYSSQSERSGATLTVRAPVPEPGDPSRALAQLDLVVSKAELAAGIRGQLLIGGIAFAVLLISFSATVHAIVRRLVVEPLRRLLVAMGRVERKEWNTADWSSDDEIGRLVQGFNRMVDSLRSGDEAKRLLRELQAVQQQLTENNGKLERANQRVLDSINYARRIQSALLPDLALLAPAVAEIAVIWEPRDIVGGDLYWAGERDGKVLLVVMDCTGHGVPGAFMTMIVASVLDRILQHEESADPARILTAMDRLVRQILRQDRAEGASDDGLDAGVCIYDRDSATLTYAGAMLPLLYTDAAGQIQTIRPDRRSLGYRPARIEREIPAGFTNHVLPVTPGMTVYLATDGVIDQPAPNGRLFGRRRLTERLQQTQDRPVTAQLDAVRAGLSSHRAEERTPDDLTLLACRLR